MVNEIIVAFLDPLHLTRQTMSRPITPEGKNSYIIIRAAARIYSVRHDGT
jgi:hypothetical protein